jgi:hypothetical protein
VCVLALGLAVVAPAQPPVETKPDPPAKPAEKPTIDPAIEALANQLADLDFEKREEAAKKLQALAVKALPSLRLLKNHKDPEVRRRVSEMVASVESAHLLQPKRLTLKFERKTAKEILDAIAKETGFKIDAFGPLKDDEHFDFDWKDVPFWEAFDQVAQAAGLMLQPSYGDDRLRVQAQDRYVPHVSYHGPFRVTADGFQELRTLDFSSFPRGKPAGKRQDLFNLHLTVCSEPGTPLLSMSDAKITAAFDNDNNSLLPLPGAPEELGTPFRNLRNGRYYGGGQRMISYLTDTPLNRASAKATTAKYIKGYVPVSVLLEQRPEVVTDKLATAKGQKFRVGTTQFVVEDVSETPNKQLQLKLSITEESAIPGGPTDPSWVNSLWHRLEVQDEKGVKLQNYGSSWGPSGSNHVQITFTYGQPGAAAVVKPAKLIYSVWTTLPAQVDFEFKDLPLP